MKRPPHRNWQPIRWLLLVACAGGILAAVNSWTGSLSLGFVDPGARFSMAQPNDSTDFSVVADTPIDSVPKAQMSIGRLTNGLLFSRPPSHWLLAAPNHGLNYSWVTQETEVAANRWNGSSFNASIISASRTPAGLGKGTTFAATGESVAGPVIESPNTVITSGLAVWLGDSAGTQNWSDMSKWLFGNVPDGAGVGASFASLNLTANRNVNLDVSRTVGYMLIGDTDSTHTYTITASPGAALIFDNGAGTPPRATLTQTASSAGDIISAPIVLRSDLYVSNLSGNTLTISGNTSSGHLFPFLVFDNGNVNVTGAITDGAGGDKLSIRKIGPGTLTLSGTNTYSFATEVDLGGTLLINGDNSGASSGSAVLVTNGSILGGTGTVGSLVAIQTSSLITGGTTATVGTLTLNSNVQLSAATMLVNLSGSTSDKLVIGGTLNLSNAVLSFDGSADGTSTYVLATYANLSGDSTFAFVFNMPDGYDLVYGATELDLVPIPEPATWIGGALALGALVFARRAKS